MLPRALSDAVQARGWYKEQREGLGKEFEQTLHAALSTISRFPDLYPRVLGDVRRCLLGRFPYGIFYAIAGDEVVLVVAVFHALRDPASYKKIVILTDRL